MNSPPKITKAPDNLNRDTIIGLIGLTVVFLTIVLKDPMLKVFGIFLGLGIGGYLFFLFTRWGGLEYLHKVISKLLNPAASLLHLDYARKIYLRKIVRRIYRELK